MIIFRSRAIKSPPRNLFSWTYSPMNYAYESRHEMHISQFEQELVADSAF